MSTGTIEKQILIHAPRSKVWKALVDAQAFGEWFGVKLEGTFEPGQPIAGQITYPGYEHLRMHVVIDRIEPEHLFSFRWHPNATDPNHDYSAELMSLVVFTLEDRGEATLVKVVESGLDQIPLERRAQVFRSNSSGWEQQMTNIERYVTTPR